MSAKDRVNKVVDGFIARVNSNLTKLGVAGIEERAEDPATMDKVREHGSWMYAVPLAEGRDRMDFMQGSPDKEMYHNWSMNVTAYFDYTNLSRDTGTLINGLRLTRDHGYDLVDLFNGDDSQVDEGFFYRAELEQGYYEIVDRIIYTYNIKFYIKILEN